MNTPGPSGYLFAVLVAFAWNALFLGAGMGVIGLVAVFVYSLIIGFPVAVAGVLVVHGLCSRVRQQWVHVAAATVAGGALTALEVLVLGGEVLPGITASVGIAAGLGRLAVVPSVHRRQGRFASSPAVRVP